MQKGSPSTRAFRLLSLLQNHRYWSGADLADRLGVSARTLRRDVDRLRELGYPVAAHPGVDGGYQLAAGAALPPLVVDDDEAVALTAGLLLATHGGLGPPGGDGADTIAEAAARALAKVTQVLPGPLRRRAEAVAAVTEATTWPGDQTRLPAVSPDVLAGVALACRDSERIRFGYTAASGEQTRRHVEPHRLVTLVRRWYLVGYDLDRLDWRSFRLDRVAGTVQPAGARFRPRPLPAGDAAEYVRQSVAGAAPLGYQVEAIVEAPADELRERIGRWSVIEEIGPGRSRVTIAANDLNWAVMGLGATGAEFQVLAPPALAERIADWGARFSRAARA
jgi:predicted DNA-binding transcriptional regulator YafY